MDKKERQFFLNNLKEKITSNDLNWYYCLGLFLADGSFKKENHRLTCFLNEKDKQIILDVSKFLGCEIKQDKKRHLYGIDFCDEIVLDLINKYEISNNKTYYPCNISQIKNKELIAFIIGFIDGDGSVHKRTDGPHSNIIIKLHFSWEENLQYLSKNLYNYFGIEKVPKTIIITTKQNKKYSSITWGNQKVIRGLLNFIEENNLLHLNRKWDKLKDVYPHIRNDNTSGVKGVYLQENTYWCAYITIKGNHIFLGSYKTKEEAIIARLKKEKELFSIDAPQYYLFKNYNI